MASGYLLFASDSLIAELSPLLESHGILCNRTDEKTVTRGRRTLDLVTFECVLDSASVELGVEKRRGRDGADIVLIPRRRVVFLEHKPSECLAKRINAILCENGADDTV
jgi:hypothetical protein